MIFRSGLLAVLVLAVSGNGTALQASIFDECSEAKLTDNKKLGLEITEKLKRFTTLNGTTLNSAIDCFSWVYGEPFVFEPISKMYLPKDSADAVIAIRKDALKKAAIVEAEEEALLAEKNAVSARDEAERKLALEEARVKRERETREQQKIEQRHQTVLVATYKACGALFQRNPNEALLNQICHEFFMETGLPD
ncbi:hypothetical protein [Nereida sp. MMG025]|uniref:hypothetical protein n=1 Tax=Nereida sp. MMG025 TaxID=2909981 RepID=UPI001F3A9008|nr:hypothetical protein [Nereida sp. MMG025]MCF6443621.1 hypothetical protein [Nereida sp. MMG025]